MGERKMRGMYGPILSSSTIVLINMCSLAKAISSAARRARLPTTVYGEAELAGQPLFCSVMVSVTPERQRSSDLLGVEVPAKMVLTRLNVALAIRYSAVRLAASIRSPMAVTGLGGK